MEFDIVKIVTTVGIPAAITFFLLWKLVPTVNGLKDVIKDLAAIVKVDSTNTANMKGAVDMNTEQVVQLRLEISKLNGNK
ncbi:unnamed protein product [marine sediment metagenome]|uniref:Uncharacterized protein n=1 Tax=marine sediment metagenome TaxID=412755 RepID=X1BI65_9ZZZZ